MQILVIDDDRDIRDVLAMVLGAEGHDVRTAPDGVAGLDQLRAGLRPSLMLLDMMMPRLDGAGFLEEVRKDPAVARIPVVVLTGRPAARRTAIELGAAGYLTKPVELEALLSAVAEVERAAPSR